MSAGTRDIAPTKLKCLFTETGLMKDSSSGRCESSGDQRKPVLFICILGTASELGDKGWEAGPDGVTPLLIASCEEVVVGICHSVKESDRLWEGEVESSPRMRPQDAGSL